MKYTFHIAYMTCQSCSGKTHCQSCSAELRELLLLKQGIDEVELDPKEKTLTVWSESLTEDDLIDAMEAVRIFEA